MKIVVIVRTLNEEQNVDRFAYCYRWADKILVADGGSTDKTKYRLNLYANVEVRDFEKRIELPNGTFINPRGEHINFLIDWGLEEKADWLIFDDFDCVPTSVLQSRGKDILRNTEEDMVFAYRMFIFKQDWWFPKMNKPGQSLWAWKSNVHVRADEASYTISMQIPKTSRRMLEHPYSLLHYFYPDEETFQRKKAQYVLTKEVTQRYDPKSQFGDMKPVPTWARW